MRKMRAYVLFFAQLSFTHFLSFVLSSLFSHFSRTLQCFLVVCLSACLSVCLSFYSLLFHSLVLSWWWLCVDDFYADQKTKNIRLIRMCLCIFIYFVQNHVEHVKISITCAPNEYATVSATTNLWECCTLTGGSDTIYFRFYATHKNIAIYRVPCSSHKQQY